ncbi:MAG TPA: heavy metal-responsive transcriptional regulator [Nevskiaceae bacterium]|nr:heavy metal-responsive transcriptional regulator [Nevskiaceae bacterium]
MTRTRPTRSPALTIGAAARAAGVAIDTLRYYERSGLLDPAQRSGSGYRLYGPAEVARLRFIRQAKALGFRLDDIADLLRLQDGGGDRVEVRDKARVRLADLDRKIRELSAIRAALAGLLARCHGSGPLAGCPIIEGVQAVSLTPSEDPTP